MGENAGSIPWRVEALEEEDAGTRLTRLEEQMKTQRELGSRIEGKLDSTNNWLRSIAGSIVVAIGLMLWNLIFKKG